MLSHLHVLQVGLALTGENVLMDTRELYVRLGRIGHDQAVGDSLSDSLRWRA